MKLKIGISLGDINGIGPEVTLKALQDERLLKLFTPIIYGSEQVLEFHRNLLGLDQLNFKVISSPDNAQAGVINLINCLEGDIDIQIGQVTEASGNFAIAALETATADVLSKKIAALVTAPIHKKAMQLGGFAYPGHTEFLTEKSGSKESVMILINDFLRVGMVTGHVPIADVAKKINKELIVKKIQILSKTLKEDFGIDRPKIAVLGLNPHAGDNGAIGQEEQQHIQPAILQVRKSGIMAFGPFPADGFFGSGNYSNYDAVLAMYHDQGLAPFKAIGFNAGVNYTAGLPFVRTSPDHGTAHDIAGTNVANPDSMIQAIFTALDVVKHRENYRDMYANPLQQQHADDVDRNAKGDGVVEER